MPRNGSSKRNGALTARGERTRQRLLDAAREVFTEQGYESTTIDGIVERAGVGHGTFYLYFSSKDDIFIPIAKEVAQKIQDAAGTVPPAHLSRYERIASANAAYLRCWIEHRRLMGEFLSQAARIPELGDHVIQLRDGFVRVVEDVIRHRQARGEALGIDPQIAAYALGGMVSWFAFDWLYRETFPFDESRFDEVVETLSRIWFRADGPGPLEEVMREATAGLELSVTNPASDDGR